MRRVRHNLLVLLPRLEAQGYLRAVPGGLSPRYNNEELDEFAYIASHDLKAPLRAIANLSGWLEEDLADLDLSPESREHLQLLHRRALRMERMVGALRRYSRIGRDIEEIKWMQKYIFGIDWKPWERKD